MIDRTFGHYVRVLIDMDISTKIRYTILVERQGFSLFTRLEYENLSHFCTYCKRPRHYLETCKLNFIPDKTKNLDNFKSSDTRENQLDDRTRINKPRIPRQSERDPNILIPPSNKGKQTMNIHESSKKVFGPDNIKVTSPDKPPNKSSILSLNENSLDSTQECTSTHTISSDETKVVRETLNKETLNSQEDLNITKNKEFLDNFWAALEDQTYSNDHEGEKDDEIEGTKEDFLTFMLALSNSQKKKLRKKHKSISTYATKSKVGAIRTYS